MSRSFTPLPPPSRFDKLVDWLGTTKLFLDYFGLKKLDDLPPLADLSDWESLRVQLNLPEVEEEQSEEPAGAADVPVLYPEVPVEEAPVEPVPDEIADLVRDEEEELVVSKWPDPAESGG